MIQSIVQFLLTAITMGIDGDVYRIRKLAKSMCKNSLEIEIKNK